MKRAKSILLALCCAAFPLCGQAQDYKVAVPSPNTRRQDIVFEMGTPVNPSGSVINITSTGMVRDGKPVLPVMGEFHYSRFPSSEWRRELLKMKAGGINIVASYIFWIHHEEEEGVYCWDGQRNLRKFVETCEEVGLPIVLRVGPWCHGEVRNGGLPQWLVQSGIRLRESNPDYLAKLQTWYAQIFQQVKGLIWKNGGPVVGVQIENEFRGRGEHLMTLKDMLQEIGFDVPLYTRTGWPKLNTPVTFGDIIPLYGDYADGFWDRTLDEMPGDYGKSYIFRSFRNSTMIATEQLPKQSDTDNPDDMGYPYFTCELGGGMTPSYHRRINIAPMDVYSMALVRVGSGSNLPGYYMYHGGTNPEGKLSTLNEQQASDFTYHNDLPVKSYDFQAPLGQFGQINPQYHQLRRLHLFLHDFGGELAVMPPVFPETMQTDFRGDSLLRWAVRSDGVSGYVFINNYHRLKTLSPKDGVQFTLSLPAGQLTFPEAPLTIPSGASFLLPFNMRLGKTTLVYATAQPMARLTEGDRQTVVFVRSEGVPAEFVFDGTGIEVLSSKGKYKTRNGQLCFTNLKPGTDPAIRLRSASGGLLTVILLDEASSLACWKGELAGKERLFLTSAGLTCHGRTLELDEDTHNKVSVSIYPAPEIIQYKNQLVEGKSNGLFTRYDLKLPAWKPVKVALRPVKTADLPLRVIQNGKANVAEMPKDADFDRAAVWNVVLPQDIDPTRNVTLRFPYIGDVARIYSGDKLLTDNFYNGKPLDLNLNHFASAPLSESGLQIKILPLQKEAPIYLPQPAKAKCPASGYTLPKVEVMERQYVVLEAK